jgi:hypothetical protein
MEIIFVPLEVKDWALVDCAKLLQSRNLNHFCDFFSAVKPILKGTLA